MPLQVLATARQALVQLAPLLAPGEQLATEVQVRGEQAYLGATDVQHGCPGLTCMVGCNQAHEGAQGLRVGAAYSPLS